MTYVIYKDGKFWMFASSLRGDSTKHAQIQMRAFGEFIERLDAVALYHDYALVRVDRVGDSDTSDTVTILATFYGTRVAAAN
jgi:hypothetical protein